MSQLIAPPRMPNGLFAPDVVPRVANDHSGAPQDGKTYQWGDPGPGLGDLLSVSSTFGIDRPQHEMCTFLGSEGTAVATRRGMQLARFADTAAILVRPGDVFVDEPIKTGWTWTYMDANHRVLLEAKGIGKGRFWGMPAEMAYARYPGKTSAHRDQEW